MQYQYVPYIWPLIASATVTLFLGIYAFLRRRNAKGAVSFILSMIVVTIWSSANALEMSSTVFSTKLFWANVQYIAYCYSPVTLLSLCMEFSGYDQWIRNRKNLWFTVIPTIILVLVWTDRLHGLIRFDMNMDYSGLFPVINKKYGPAFYIHAVYSHSLNIFAWVLLIKSIFSKNTVYRRQAISLFIGLSLIIFPNIMYILNLSPIRRLDTTPLFFGPAGLIAAWGIFRFKLFEVVPLAWATVIKTMDVGVMVLDLQDRVLDINPALEKIVGCTASTAFTKSVKSVCSKNPELITACTDRSIAHTEFSINNGDSSKIYEALLTPLTDDKDVLIGRLAVIYDITEKKQAQKEFLKQQWELAVIEERERMARDLHDNLGQVLGFINFQAQGIRQELINADIDIVSDKLEKLANVTQSAHTEIRKYICDIRNSAYMEKDFITALKKEISDFREQTGLTVKLDISGEFTHKNIKPNISINVLNIVKEALNNIRKHAEAENVRILFALEQEQLYAIIEDDGKGFNLLKNHGTVKNRFGLNILHERALIIGGKIDVKSVIGHGSKIILRVPFSGGIKKNASETDVGR